MNEEWLPVPVKGLEEYYLVSSQGRVYRRPYENYRGKIIPGKILEGYVQPIGYRVVSMTDGNGHKAQYRVHRLVCIAFHGRSHKPLVCHKNGDKLDNRAENLYWGTHADNYQDSVDHGTAPVGLKSPNAKLSDEDVKNIRESNLTGVELAAKYEVSRSHISGIIHGNKRKR